MDIITLLLIKWTISFLKKNNTCNAAAVFMAGLAPKICLLYVQSEGLVIMMASSLKWKVKLGRCVCCNGYDIIATKIKRYYS